MSRFFTPHPLADSLLLMHTQPSHAAELAVLQHIVFPSLADSERMKAEHYLHHIRLFPEGQIVVLHEGRVVAGSSSIRHAFPQGSHRFADISAQLWLDTHQPDGDWLYGMDLGVHPDYRRQGIARAIYAARNILCQQMGLRGQVIVGMLNGYTSHAHQMDVATYAREVMAGRLQDPTISAQMNIGFEPLHFLPDYLHDPQCGDGGLLMQRPTHTTSPSFV